jgi:hypothetical protein
LKTINFKRKNKFQSNSKQNLRPRRATGLKYKILAKLAKVRQQTKDKRLTNDKRQAEYNRLTSMTSDKRAESRSVNVEVEVLNSTEFI